jgi:methylenetetrahydrofolate reductase (NADPH)
MSNSHPAPDNKWRIDEALNKGKATLSFEFFPPKDDAGYDQLFRAIEELRPLSPDYVSVTYRPGGSSRDKTLQLVSRIQNELAIRAMAHLTCVGHAREEIGEFLDRLWEKGIANVLALRGDPPAGEHFTPHENGFGYASELVPFVRARHDFCVAVAGYPESHPQSLNPTRDLEMLKLKVDQGASVVITQLFFNNDDFYRWRDNARKMGVTVPIIAGIMPILSATQIKRMVMVCGAKIPHPLLLQLESLDNDPVAVRAAGMKHTLEQCEDLLQNGVDGLHFYTLNKSTATAEIGWELNRS